MQNQDLKSLDVATISKHRPTLTLWLLSMVSVSFLTPLVGQTKEQTLTYEDSPLSVVLTVGEEKQIVFKESIELGYKAAALGGLLIDNVQGILYLTATQPFPTQRFALKGVESGRVVLLDLEATEQAGDFSKIFVEPSGSQQHRDSSMTDTMTPIQLLRYVAQHIYAPTRLLPSDARVRRIYPDLGDFTLFENPVLKNKHLAAWKTENYVIVVFEITNISEASLWLTEERASGDWHLLGLMSQRLLPATKRGSTQVVFALGDARKLRFH